MERLLSFRLILLAAVGGVCNANLNHRCLAGSETFACILPMFDYEPGEDIPVFHIPENVTSVRFIAPIYFVHESKSIIKVYDLVLHRQLNSPRAIELCGSYTTAVEIPSNLEYADFASNNIQQVCVPEGQSSALRYLDLNSNHHVRLDNISRLANLETLHLSGCEIESLPAGMFQNLNHLAHLTLSGNSMHRVDLSVFPVSITLLRLDRNWMTEFQFAGIGRYPLLEDLNIEYNDLDTLDIDALLAVAPNLRLFSVGRNPMKLTTLTSILNTLDKLYIAYYNMEQPSDQECDPGERRYRRACIPESSFSLDWLDWMELVMLFLAIVAVLFAVAIGGTKLWAHWQTRSHSVDVTVEAS
uniref:Leucine rich immune protein (Coil-less) n=1 Tax=Anopheles farauti TaxID=69004 RepID=A0A182Q8K2_9DIPT